MKPIITKLENKRDQFGMKNTGVVDVVYFDGARNCDVAGDLLEKLFQRITAIHGTEHVLSLYFQDVFTKSPEYMLLANVARRIRNVFGSIWHVTTAMFDAYIKKHNHGIGIGFIKVSECR